MAESRSLGKGIRELIPQGEIVVEPKMRLLPISAIVVRKGQPREKISDKSIEGLADSIKTQGLLQPIVVRPSGDKFILIAGERRLKAARMAKLDKIPAFLQDIADEKALEAQLVENLQREDLNPIELASAFERHMRDTGCTQEELARRIGLTRSYVANTVRLLHLPDEIKVALKSDEITAGHARSLLGLPEEEQLKLLNAIREKGLTVRDLESRHKKSKGEKTPGAKQKLAPSEVRSAEKSLEDVLGTRVEIRYRKGKGSIVIRYYSDSDLERVVSLLGGHFPLF